jgi:hypothetical protein
MTPKSTVKSTDKIKLLDQMLEDMAGEEFESDESYGIEYESDFKRYSGDAQLSEIDNIH